MAAALGQQFAGLRCPPLSSSPLAKPVQRGSPLPCRPLVVAQAVNLNTNALQAREKVQLKEQFEQAYDRCRTAPMEGVSFSVDDFLSALEKYDFDSEVGTKVCLPLYPTFSHHPSLPLSLSISSLHLGRVGILLSRTLSLCLSWSQFERPREFAERLGQGCAVILPWIRGASLSLSVLFPCLGEYNLPILG